MGGLFRKRDRAGGFQEEAKPPADVAVEAEVGLHLDEGGDFLGARLSISIPGIERFIARGTVHDAKRISTCSTATQGNIGVTYNVVLGR